MNSHNCWFSHSWCEIGKESDNNKEKSRRIVMNLMGIINQKHNATVQMVKAQYQKQTAAKTGGANAKPAQEQADISHIKTTQGRILDTYTLATRVMSYEEFHELMTSDKSSMEKHAALYEAYGDVLSYSAYEKGMQAIQNGTYSLEEFHVEMERRSESLRLNPRGKSQFSMMAPGPNDEDVARSIELSKRYIPIQNKMLAGKLLSDEEKNFLKEHFPEAYAKAIQIEQEVAQLKARLRASKSKEEANRIYMETKMNLMSGGVNDKGMLLMMPAIDEAYRESMKQS